MGKEYRQTLLSAVYVNKKWIHKRCSGVRGDLSQVANRFRCRQCDGTIQEDDLAEDLMGDGETYGCVKSFCYLRDTLLFMCGRFWKVWSLIFFLLYEFKHWIVEGGLV